MDLLIEIETREQHAIALARIAQLMDADASSPELAELETLGALVERYETQAFPLKVI